MKNRWLIGIVLFLWFTAALSGMALVLLGHIAALPGPAAGALCIDAVITGALIFLSGFCVGWCFDEWAKRTHGKGKPSKGKPMKLMATIRSKVRRMICVWLGHKWGPRERLAQHYADGRINPLNLYAERCLRCGKGRRIALPPQHPNCRCSAEAARARNRQKERE